MPFFKPPTFQERAVLAANAKRTALERLRAKAPADNADFSARQDARAAREAAEAKKRDEKRFAREQEKAEREARTIEAPEVEESTPVMSDGERKAARDARYARRRSRIGTS